MKIIYLLFLGVAFLSNYAMSQNDSLNELQEIYSYKKSKIIKACFFNPGITFEYGISKNKSINFEVGIAGITCGQVVPGCRSELRYYYRLEKRISKQLNTESFSGEFFSLCLGYIYNSHIIPPPYYILDNSLINNVILVGPTWGMQRTYKKLNLGFNFGYGYTYYPSINSLDRGLLFDINMGFEIFNKK